MDQLHATVQKYSKKRWTHSYLKLTSIYLRMLHCLNVLLWFYLGMYIKKIGTPSNQTTSSHQPVRTSPNQFGQPDRNNQIGPANSNHQFRPPKETSIQFGPPKQTSIQFGPPKETPITLDSRMIWRRMSTHWKAYEVYFPTQQVSRHLDFPIRIYGRIIEDCSECQESHRNGHFTEDCAEAQETRGNWRPSREWFTCWPSIFQRGDFSSYLSRRVVPSINILYVY